MACWQSLDNETQILVASVSEDADARSTIPPCSCCVISGVNVLVTTCRDICEFPLIAAILYYFFMAWSTSKKKGAVHIVVQLVAANLF